MLGKMIMFRLTSLTRRAPFYTQHFIDYLSTADKSVVDVQNDLSIEQKLDIKFKSHPVDVQNAPGTLFRDIETYKMSLPVRMRPIEDPEKRYERLKLYTLPFFGFDEDIETMARQLEAGRTYSSDRQVIKYLSAPSGSGKTASILPAFLQSDFTHYLYIAFSNNDNRQFKYRVNGGNPDEDPMIAAQQGRAFAYECVRSLLMEPDPKGTYTLTNTAELDTNYVERLQELLGSLFGKGHKVLFHLDEHKKMCKKTESGAVFRAAVMTTLDECGAVIATFTSPPWDLPSKQSSQACREAVAKAVSDMVRVCQYCEVELPSPTHHDLDWSSRRRLALLKFKIAMALESPHGLGLAAIHRLDNSPKHQKFFLKLSEELNQKDKNLDERLKTCIEGIKIDLSEEVDLTEHATKLLLGIKDTEKERFGRHLNDLIVLPNRRLTSTITQLLKFDDDTNEHLKRVYEKGRDRMSKMIQRTDLLENTPLEVGFQWVVTCRSAAEKRLKFKSSASSDDLIFPIHCKDIRGARIFEPQFTDVNKDQFDLITPLNNKPETPDSVGGKGEPAGDFRVYHLEHGIIYYALEEKRADDEGKGNRSHPRADMFFRTGNDHLVLIDITGSKRKSEIKLNNMKDTIKKMQAALAANGGDTHQYTRTHIRACIHMARSHTWWFVC